MKKEASISLTQHGCCCDKGAMPMGCCKNESKYIKITDDYLPASELHAEKTDIAPVVLNFIYTPYISHDLVFIPSNNHSPPPKFADRVIAFRSILV